MSDNLWNRYEAMAVERDQLRAALRSQLAAAAKPGLAGVQALAAAAQTVDDLSDAVRLIEQCYADRECIRQGHTLREMGTAEEIYAAAERARAAHPEAWEGVRE